MSVACPRCGAQTTLAAEPEPALIEPFEITAAELQAAFGGPVRRHRISLFYQAGLLVVEVLMLLLPVAYFALAALAGYGVYWYAVHARALFSSLSGGAHVLIFKVVIYIAPIIAGVVAVFFMFKPILARSPKTADPLELDPAKHQRLYQFIAQICDLLRVSMPKRIFLDCNLNAGAGFRRGFLSFFGHDLVMIIGLPLVAGLNTRQFAVVIAHELGHCTQGMAMRLTYVIDQVDRWFLRVIYERDSWDESFEEWADSVEDWRLSLIVGCAGVAIWVSRKVLALLMLIGHAASCFLARQMEYHADACSMAIAGSEALESLQLRLREQSILEELAYDGLQEIWQKRNQLPDSLPGFLEHLEAGMPANFHEQAQHTLLNETAGLFATHPTAAQRIRKARRSAQPGVFALEKPARALFHDFPRVAQVVTACHYRQTLGLPVTNPMLKPVAEFFPARRESLRR